MTIVSKLIACGLRQVVGEAAEFVVAQVERLFIDHSQTLPKALARASDRTWQALGIALAGDSFLDKLRLLPASGDAKAIREQVHLFLDQNTDQFDGCPADFRQTCLVELQTARGMGWLSAQNLTPNDIARQSASFKRYADLKGLVGGAEETLGQLVDEFSVTFPNLGRFLIMHVGEDPPLVISAFTYFFRREVETDAELFRGLSIDNLRQLSASQSQGFAEVDKALTALGGRFELMFDQLDRIEKAVIETQNKAASTTQAIQEMQAEVQRLGNLGMTHVEEVLALLRRHLQRGSQTEDQKHELSAAGKAGEGSDLDRHQKQSSLVQRQRVFFPKGSQPPSDEIIYLALDPHSQLSPYFGYRGNQIAVNSLRLIDFHALKKYNHITNDVHVALVGPKPICEDLVCRHNKARRLPFVSVGVGDADTTDDIFDMISGTVHVNDCTLVEFEPGNYYVLPPMDIFISEIHRLPNDVTQRLLKAMESGILLTETGFTIDCANVHWILAGADVSIMSVDTRFMKIETVEAKFAPLIGFLYKPRLNQDLPQHFSNQIRDWLRAYLHDKALLKPYLDQFLAHAHLKAEIGRENQIVVATVGEFLDKDEPTCGQDDSAGAEETEGQAMYKAWKAKINKRPKTLAEWEEMVAAEEAAKQHEPQTPESE